MKLTDHKRDVLDELIAAHLESQVRQVDAMTTQALELKGEWAVTSMSVAEVKGDK